MYYFLQHSLFPPNTTSGLNFEINIDTTEVQVLQSPPFLFEGTIFIQSESQIARIPFVVNETDRIIHTNISASGANNGTTWTDAFSSLQDAIANSKSGDEIWVASGDYKPDKGENIAAGNRAISFRLKNGVKIYGGFSGNETQRDRRNYQNNITILSGDLDDNDGINFTNNSDNSFHVVSMKGALLYSTVLDGFTIKGGNANSSADIDGFGGGILIEISNPIITNCQITENFAETGGGGLCVLDSLPSISLCTFSNNSTRNAGGGLFNLDSSPSISDCNFFDNTADLFGGGAFNDSSAANFTSCNFRGNESDLGGGIYEFSSGSSFLNCRFAGNRATEDGGAISCETSTTEILQSIFTGNSAGSFAGAIDSFLNSNISVTNCSFSGNSAGIDGGGIAILSDSTAIIEQSILWGDFPQNHEISGSHAGSNNLILGGLGPFDNNPDFEDPNGIDNVFGTLDDNLNIGADSRAIDSGKNNLIRFDTDTDFAGNPRLIDDPDIQNKVSNSDFVDIGAYEFQDITSVEFSSATSSVNENGGTHVVSVKLNLPRDGQLTEEVSLTIGNSSRTARSTSDYAPVAFDVTFPAGSQDGDEKNIPVEIFDDNLIEGQENFVIVIGFSISGPANRGNQFEHEVFINDDEPSAVVDFTVPQSTFSEEDPTGHQIFLSLYRIFD